jgi:hypothetical protein
MDRGFLTHRQGNTNNVVLAANHNSVACSDGRLSFRPILGVLSVNPKKSSRREKSNFRSRLNLLGLFGYHGLEIYSAGDR